MLTLGPGCSLPRHRVGQAGLSPLLVLHTFQPQVLLSCGSTAYRLLRLCQVPQSLVWLSEKRQDTEIGNSRALDLPNRSLVPTTIINPLDDLLCLRTG